METEMIDKLFLELSQFTKARTAREIEQQKEIQKLDARVRDLEERLIEQEARRFPQ